MKRHQKRTKEQKMTGISESEPIPTSWFVSIDPGFTHCGIVTAKIDGDASKGVTIWFEPKHSGTYALCHMQSAGNPFEMTMCMNDLLRDMWPQSRIKDRTKDDMDEDDTFVHLSEATVLIEQAYTTGPQRNSMLNRSLKLLEAHLYLCFKYKFNSFVFLQSSNATKRFLKIAKRDYDANKVAAFEHAKTLFDKDDAPFIVRDHHMADCVNQLLYKVKQVFPDTPIKCKVIKP